MQTYAYVAKSELNVELPAEKWPYKMESRAKVEKCLREGDKISLGQNSHLEIIHLPGHTPGSIGILFEKYLFTGDMLFQDAPMIDFYANQGKVNLDITEVSY